MGIVIRPFRETDQAAVIALTVAAFPGVSIEHNVDERLGAVAERDWQWRKGRDVELDIDLRPIPLRRSDSGYSWTGASDASHDPDRGLLAGPARFRPCRPSLPDSSRRRSTPMSAMSATHRREDEIRTFLGSSVLKCEAWDFSLFCRSQSFC